MANEVIQTEYSEIMQKSYIDYAMSVIVARALPDVRDGLKPVQRRTLYDMYELGIRYDKPYRKSARIVGDTMGKYHPHGDSSIYGALVVMAQDFKMGLPLVDGHGNFGSIEGDGAAAMRYTEARLEKITQEAFLSDLDKGVVEFGPNFDENEKEPLVLPARIPNLLVNGSEGIAVGMATSIPPHNLGEVIDAVIALIQDNSLTDDGLMKYVQGPDFPTGGIVVNRDELPEIYRTGSGRIRIRGKVEVEKIPRTDRLRLVITEIPYTMIGAGIGKFLNDVAALADVWYRGNGANYGRDQHYNGSRYHMLNLHATFTKGTVEFRLFQFDAPDGKRQNGIHAGQLKSYIQLCLALSQLAKDVRTASPKPQQNENPKYAMRTWLLRLGFIGEEFATARDFLTRNLDGDAAFRNGRAAA